jgi:hypothetical protein
MITLALGDTCYPWFREIFDNLGSGEIHDILGSRDTWYTWFQGNMTAFAQETRYPYSLVSQGHTITLAPELYIVLDSGGTRDTVA